MGEEAADSAYIAPWLGPGEVVLWSGRARCRTWLVVLGRVVLTLAVLAAVLGSSILGLRSQGRLLTPSVRTFALATFGLFLVGVMGATSVPAVMLARDSRRRTVFVVTNQRAFSLVPLANRILNRYAVLQPGARVRVRFRWGDTARLEVGSPLSVRNQFALMPRVLQDAVDVGLASMQGCLDADAGAAAARSAIAALSDGPPSSS